MANEKQLSDFTTGDIRRIMQTKMPPENDRERVYHSIILTLAEKLDRLREETKRAVKFLAENMKDINEVLAESAGTPTTDAPSAETEQPEPPRDSTPFPAGFSAAGAPGAGAPPPKTQQAAPPVVEAEEGEMQNTSRVTQTAPIPRAASAPPPPQAPRVQTTGPNGAKS
jgi:hypothetical protein